MPSPCSRPTRGPSPRRERNTPRPRPCRAGHHSSRVHLKTAPLPLSHPLLPLVSIAPPQVPASEQYEHSELLLYEGSILEEDGKSADALAFYQRHRRSIVDLLSLNEALARLHLKLGERAEAKELYRKLLRSNADCHDYHAGLWASMGARPTTLLCSLWDDWEAVPPPRGVLLSPVSSAARQASSRTVNEVFVAHRPVPAGMPPLAEAASLSADQVSALSAEYADLRAEHPRSSCCRRIPLDFLQGPAFESALSEYVQPFLRKGVPSLFADLKPLFHSTPEKRAALERVVSSAVDSLRARSAFPGAPDGSQRPGVLPWSLMLLAELRGLQGRLPEAIAAADEALAHSPTVIDVHSVRAELLGRAGDAAAAAEVAEEARKMDLADRYLNCAAVKKMLLAGQVREAEETVALFARSGGDGGESNLVDMQVPPCPAPSHSLTHS